MEGALPDARDLGAFAEVMRVLGDETRLRLLRALGDRSLCVGDLAQAIGASQPLVSHHLKALKHAGLVACHKEGPWVYYSVRADSFVRLGLGALRQAGGPLDGMGGGDPASGAAPEDGAAATPGSAAAEAP
jgi:ArsR family transcriptional regulator